MMAGSEERGMLCVVCCVLCWVVGDYSGGRGQRRCSHSFIHSYMGRGWAGSRAAPVQITFREAAFAFAFTFASVPRPPFKRKPSQPWALSQYQIRP